MKGTYDWQPEVCLHRSKHAVAELTVLSVCSGVGLCAEAAAPVGALPQMSRAWSRVVARRLLMPVLGAAPAPVPDVEPVPVVDPVPVPVVAGAVVGTSAQALSNAFRLLPSCVGIFAAGTLYSRHSTVPAALVPKTKLWHWVLLSHWVWQVAAVVAEGVDSGWTELVVVEGTTSQVARLRTAVRLAVVMPMGRRAAVMRVVRVRRRVRVWNCIFMEVVVVLRVLWWSIGLGEE